MYAHQDLFASKISTLESVALRAGVSHSRLRAGCSGQRQERRGKSLGRQLHELFVKVGSFYPQRKNFRLTRDAKEKFTEKLGQNPRDFFGRKVKEVVRTDGLKLICEDGSWGCYRLSGSEPVVRVYSEAGSAEERGKLSAAAKQWIFE
jgi:phosphoglucomutase